MVKKLFAKFLSKVTSLRKPGGPEKELYKVWCYIILLPFALEWRCMHQSAQQISQSNTQHKIYVSVLNILW